MHFYESISIDTHTHIGYDLLKCTNVHPCVFSERKKSNFMYCHVLLVLMSSRTSAIGSKFLSFLVMPWL
jgi:hypothetical protein